VPGPGAGLAGRQTRGPAQGRAAGDDLGLEAASIRLDLQSSGAPRPAPAAALVRTAQEALANVGRHARAHGEPIGLRRKPGVDSPSALLKFAVAHGWTQL
jgi:hypothetical protein